MTLFKQLENAQYPLRILYQIYVNHVAVMIKLPLPPGRMKEDGREVMLLE